ncbi:MAG: hypothetical protein ACRC1H_07135 [Caldilineaceae bacterium]
MREQNERMRRRLLSGAAALVVVVSLFATAGVAMAQSGALFGLGCWAITSAGATGGNYQSASYRMQYAVPWIGTTDATQAAPASTNFRLRSNHFAARALLSPSVPGAPPAGPQFQYLPLVWGEFLNLDQLNSCR